MYMYFLIAKNETIFKETFLFQSVNISGLENKVSKFVF